MAETMGETMAAAAVISPGGPRGQASLLRPAAVPKSAQRADEVILIGASARQGGTESAALLLSRSTPMLRFLDHIRRTTTLTNAAI